MSKRAAIYARVSTDEQAERGYSLPAQIEDCQRYAQRHGFSVAGVFSDDYTGTVAIDERPEGRRLQLLVASGAADAVVCYNVKRLGRNMVDLLIVARDWLRAGVQLHFCEGGEVSSENDLTLIIQGWEAQRDRDATVKRLDRGRRGKAKAGKVMLHGDRPPYGYRVTEDDQLVIHEPEARIVRQVFDWYVHGADGERLSMPSLARRLTAICVPTWEDVHGLTGQKKRARGVWAAGSVAHMLHYEAYKGTWHYGKTGKKRENPREEWIAVSVPAIVSADLWEAAQKQAKRNRRRAGRAATHEYLLRYRLTCSCGYAVQCQAKHNRLANGTMRHYLYYSCGGIRRQSVRECEMPSFRADQVDAAVWIRVRGWLLEPKLLMQEMRERQTDRGKELAPTRSRLATVEFLLSQNRAKMARLLDLFLTGDFEKDILTHRRGELQRVMDALEEERAKLLAAIDAYRLTEEQIASIPQLAAEVRAHLEGGEKDFARRRRVIEMLKVEGVLAIEDGVKVVHIRATLSGLQARVNLGESSTTSCNSRTASTGW